MSPGSHSGNDTATGDAAFTLFPVRFDGESAPHILKLRKYVCWSVGEAQEESSPPKKVEKNRPPTDAIESEFRYWIPLCEIASRSL